METFVTSRTKIAPLNESDIPEILEMYHEPDTFKFIAPHKDKPDEYYNHFLSSKIEANKVETGFWVVRSNCANEFMGTINLNQFMQTNKFTWDVI